MDNRTNTPTLAALPMQNGGQAEDEMMMDSLCYFKNCLITHFDTRAVFFYLSYFNSIMY